jgi:hypothetical protein
MKSKKGELVGILSVISIVIIMTIFLFIFGIKQTNIINNSGCINKTINNTKYCRVMNTTSNHYTYVPYVVWRNNYESSSYKSIKSNGQ